MRIILYLIIFITTSCCISSCSKGDIVKDPQFGKIAIVNTSPEMINVIQGEDQKFTANGMAITTLSGKSRFRFYTGGVALLDTSLSVEPYVNHIYTMFKPNVNANLKIFDSNFNGLNKEIQPDSGLVKFSIANFSRSLPDRVNMYISTSTYIPFSDKTIQVGEFLNVSSSFSPFKSLVLGVKQSGLYVNTFTVTIKSLDNQSVLATFPFVLPIGATAGTIGKIQGSVYLLYLNDSGTMSILMSK